MKMRVFIFFIFSMAVFVAVAQTHGYSNIDNVGQAAFSILQNFSHTNKEKFALNFYSNIKMVENISGVKFPDNYCDSMYSEIKNAGIKTNIKWANIK